VAGTEKGICAVSMGDSEKILEAFLVSEYESAKIQRQQSGELAIWTKRILRYLENDEVVLLEDLPLDIRATSFQYRVWRELQSIPYGATRSYSEIAQRLSSKAASRAVGSACAENPVSLVIPCHRAIRRDGSLGGYGSGLDRKASILRREKQNLER
jgi:AraC family transcriptional regulator of adaptative response/methylated-DNA-[protein]-cysteine methyltransferase